MQHVRQYCKWVPIACPVCNQISPSQKALIFHVQTCHPNYRYPCGYCPRTFASYNTRYKHVKEHSQPQLNCPVCNKGFHFQSELQRHTPVHSTVLPFPCTLCDKRFASSKSLTRHSVIHSNLLFQCSLCEKAYPTPDRWYAHFRGAHGKGYDAPCGDHFNWPGARARHQEHCKICQVEIAKRKKEHWNYSDWSSIMIIYEHFYSSQCLSWCFMVYESDMNKFFKI